jgi:hypothetical protein
VADRAGNVKNATVSGIQIDRTAPSSLISLPDPLASTWYGGPVTVTLHPVDSLSGVDATFFSVDGGAAQAYAGPFSFGLGGIHALTFWSTDRAGNTEDNTAVQNTVILKIDNVPPTIDGHRVPVANEFGWNNGPVTVTFDCADAESGVAACDPGVTLDNEGAGQGYTGTAQDVAGNTSQATVDGINIDLTPPTLTGAATDSPNAFGWYRGDVTIHWTGTDGLSGIDPATQPADDAITGEGGNLGAGPASVSDRAGNIAFGSVSGIRIDRTPPAISGAVVKNDGSLRTPNPAGWFNSAVRVRFACSDALSGVQECGQDVVLSGDGFGQSATGAATDRADNAAGTTVSGINIDAQPPQSTASISCTKKNGYCSGSSATVVLTAVDQAGLSGVKEIHFSVDGGAWVVSAGASKTVPVPLSGSGTATVAFYAVDNAGNSEAVSGVDITYDTIAPAVTHTLSPAANAAGWNHADTTVHFDARDDSDGSGVDPSTVTPDQTVSTETAGVDVNGSAEDYAGNVGVDSVTVRLDKTAPTISGAATTSPNANGWYQTPVTITFACNDSLSGVATCGPGQTLSTDGANQAVTGNAVDRADNASSKTVSGINIDTAQPAMTVNGVADGGVYTLGSVPGGSCTASDGGSGLAGPCAFTRSGGLTNGVGTFTFAATASDRAGNTSTITGSYRVIYRFDGFLQPINDTAHQIGSATSVFKAGSTVPAKLQLMRADGTVVSANAPPQWLTPAKGTAISAPVDESLYGDPATSGSTYRWDSSGQQYLYNWGTAKNQANSFWRVGVLLDDGQTYYVNIGLR